MGDGEGLLSSRRRKNKGDIPACGSLCELRGETKSGRPTPQTQQTSQAESKIQTKRLLKQQVVISLMVLLNTQSSIQSIHYIIPRHVQPTLVGLCEIRGTYWLDSP